ncbi:MAG: hypothetical protein A3K18_13530 [Lentisphaerae bacterium RIFOXYA12_64_32]|nr:MAG: hypothetical protein A3K18_13530 [Lentisphaerae bacterium RIFOXYA12_64_32]
MPSRRKLTPRAAFILAGAAGKGLTLADIQVRARAHASVFYRVVRGERTSARIDRVIAHAIGVCPRELRNLRRSQQPTR